MVVQRKENLFHDGIFPSVVPTHRVKRQKPNHQPKIKKKIEVKKKRQ